MRIRLRAFRLIAVAALALGAARGAHAGPVPAPSGPSAEGLQDETRRRVTDEIKRFLEERCAQQCDVGQVTVTVSKRKPPVGSTPGFEELAPDVKDYVVERADVDLILDQRLPVAFRAGVRGVVQKKLAAEGIQAALHESLIRFPTAIEAGATLPQPPQPQAQPAPQQPQAQPPQRNPEREPAVEREAVARSPWDRFFETLPLLLGLVLCGVVVWFTLRQYHRLLEARLAAQQGGTEKERSAKTAAQAQAEQEAQARARREVERHVEDIKVRLSANRVVARAAARDLLVHGAPADAALTAALLGPGILDSVRNDPDCRSGFRALDDYLAERSPSDTIEDRKRVLADLERRLLRAQVARGESEEGTPLAWLAEVDPLLFADLLGDEPPAAQALLLRHAPPSLVQVYVERQPPSVRERLVLPLLELGAVPREEVEQVAAAFRQRVTAHLAVGGASGNPVGELLDALSPAERRRLLSSLSRKPDQLRAALRSFVSEETLAGLEGDVVAQALTRLDPATAALFAGSLDEAARRKLIEALPAAMARSIAEEAQVITASPARRAAARRAALTAVRAAIEERGLDLAEINRRILAGHQEVAS